MPDGSEGLTLLAENTKGTVLRFKADAPKLTQKDRLEVKASLKSWIDSLGGLEKALGEGGALRAQLEEDRKSGYRSPPPAPAALPTLEEIGAWKPDSPAYDRVTAYLVGVFQLMQKDEYIKRDEVVGFRTWGRLNTGYAVTSVETSVRKGELTLAAERGPIKEWEKKTVDAFETAIGKAIEQHNKAAKSDGEKIAAKQLDIKGGYDKDFAASVKALQRVWKMPETGVVDAKFIEMLEEQGHLKRSEESKRAQNTGKSDGEAGQAAEQNASKPADNSEWITIKPADAKAGDSPVSLTVSRYSELAARQLTPTQLAAMTGERAYKRAGYHLFKLVATGSDEEVKDFRDFIKLFSSAGYDKPDFGVKETDPDKRRAQITKREQQIREFDPELFNSLTATELRQVVRALISVYPAIREENAAQEQKFSLRHRLGKATYDAKLFEPEIRANDLAPPAGK